jgi:DNA-damage-inducible protein D
MKNEIISQLAKNFEEYAHEHDGIEFWYARDLQKLLDYTDIRNFLNVVEKARTSCENSGQTNSDHFVDINRMVPLGSGSEREVSDIMLTCYACYLIAQNGNPQKEQIAFAQTYFAVQTRKQELLEERLRLDERLKARKKLTETETLLSQLIYEHGVDDKGFGRIRSQGDQALFGGLNTNER